VFVIKIIVQLALGVVLASCRASPRQPITSMYWTCRPSQRSGHQEPVVGMARAGERLVTVGQRGHILYSDDSGKHWQQAVVPVSSRPHRGEFSDHHPGLGGGQ
jgi:photosystem II stability/assembly factor-like uncharacterized protein